MVRKTVYLEDRQIELIRMLAKRQGVSFSRMVNILVAEGLALFKKEGKF